ncbi:MAG: glutamine synthetase III, partial [Proteobacteria bacterium]|nr:glutamine synthetase III [Pseudomonadota bacterium]
MSDNCTCGCGNDYDQNLMTVPELFGSNVFNNKTMKERLPKETYKALQKTINTGSALPPDVASVVANAMKDWAIEKGA